MHVVMFDPGNYTPHYVENLSNALVRLGVKVSLITSPGLFEESWKTVPFDVENHFFKATGGSARSFYRRHSILRRARKVLSYPAGLWRSWRALKNYPPGILHVQWALLPLLDAMLFRRLRSAGWRVLYTAHDVAHELNGPLLRWLYGAVHREVDTVIVHAEALERELRGTSAKIQVRTIPEGISSFPLSPGLDPASARRRLGLNATGPILLFFGFIKPYKGLDYLLGAWPRVVKEHPGARLLIAGEAISSLRPFYKLIDSLNLQGSVILREGYVPQPEVQNFFCAADAVVLPYVHTSTSGVVPLAYRYARPVIATSAGALPEMVKEGETGFLATPRSESALADAICRAFQDRERLADMGARARDWFENERNWDRVAEQTVELYRSLLSEDRYVSAARKLAG